MKNDDEKLSRPILSSEQEDYISTVDSGIKFLRACFVIRNAPRSSRGRKDETRIHGIRKVIEVGEVEDTAPYSIFSFPQKPKPK